MANVSRHPIELKSYFQNKLFYPSASTVCFSPMWSSYSDWSSDYTRTFIYGICTHSLQRSSSSGNAGPKQRRRENERQIKIVAVKPRNHETSHSTCNTDNCSTINSSFVSLYFTSSLKLCLQVSINIVVFYAVLLCLFEFLQDTKS